MKTKLYFLFILGLAILSCEEIPDLNPNTTAGSDISVYEIGDTLVNHLVFPGVSFIEMNYDLDEDGTDDVSFFFKEISDEFPFPAAYSIEVNGELLLKQQANNQADPKLAVLNSNNAFNAFNTYFDDADPNLINGICFPITLSDECSKGLTTAILPQGDKYIMIKLNVNGALHYGWISYSFAWEYNEDFFTGIGALIINQIGVANQAGRVLRAGQTN